MNIDVSECLYEIGVGYLSIALLIEDVVGVEHGLEVIFLEEVALFLHLLQNCYHLLFNLIRAAFDEFGD